MPADSQPWETREAFCRTFHVGRSVWFVDDWGDWRRYFVHVAPRHGESVYVRPAFVRSGELWLARRVCRATLRELVRSGMLALQEPFKCDPEERTQASAPPGGAVSSPLRTSGARPPAAALGADPTGGGERSPGGAEREGEHRESRPSRPTGASAAAVGVPFAICSGGAAAADFVALGLFAFGAVAFFLGGFALFAWILDRLDARARRGPRR